MFELSGVRVIEWFLWESISEGSTGIQKQFELLEVRVIGSVLYILFIVMTDKSVQIVNKPAFLEVSYGEVLIPIAINIPIEFSPASPVLPKAPTMGHLPSNEATNIQH